MAFGKAGKASGLVVRMMMDTAQFDRKADTATKKMANMKRVIAGFGAAAGTASLGLGAIAVGFGAIAKAGSEFEHKMVRVKALLGGTGEDMKMLSSLALDLASDTEYTASQVTDAFEAMSKAGFKAHEIAAATEAVLAVATVGGAGLGQSAEFVSKMLRQFNMEATQASEVADLMAVALTKSMLNFESLSAAMVYAGPISNQFGQSVEQVFTTLSKLADIGIEGSIAGTGMRMGLSALAKETPKAEAALKDLGLTFEDITPGKGVENMEEAVLRMKKAGAETGDYIDVFGARFAPSALGLAQYEGNLVSLAKKFPELKTRAEEFADSQGKAAKIQSDMMNSVTGSMLKIGSKFNALMIRLFELIVGKDSNSGLGGAINFVRTFLDEFYESFMDRFGVLEAAFRTAFAAWTGPAVDAKDAADIWADALIGIGLAIAGAIALIGDVWTTWSRVTGPIQRSLIFINGLIKILSAVVANLFTKFIHWNLALASKALQSIGKIITYLSGLIAKRFGGSGKVGGVMSLIAAFFSKLINKWLGGTIRKIKEVAQEVSKVGKKIAGTSLFKFVFGGGDSAAALNEINNVIGAAGDAVGLDGVKANSAQLQGAGIAGRDQSGASAHSEFEKLKAEAARDAEDSVKDSEGAGGDSGGGGGGVAVERVSKVKELELEILQARKDSTKNSQERFELETKISNLTFAARMKELETAEEKMALLEAWGLANKKISDDRDVRDEVAAKKAAADIEKLRELRLSAARSHRDMENDLLEEGKEKRKAIINARFDDETAALVERYGSETELLEGILKLLERRRAAALEVVESEKKTTKELREQLELKLKMAKESGDKAGVKSAKKELRGLNRKELKEGGGLNLGKSIGNAMASQFPQLAKFAADVKEFGLGTTILKGAVDLAGKAIAGLAKGISSLVMGPLKSVGKMSGELMQTFGQAVNFGTEVIDEIGKIATDIMNLASVGSIFAMAGETQTLMEEGGSAEEAAKSVVTDKVDQIMGYIDAVIQALPYIMEQIAHQLPILINKLVEAIPVIVDAFIKNFPAIVMALARGIPQIVGAVIKELPRLVWAIIKELPKIIWEFVKAIAKAIADALAGIFGGRGKEYREKKREIKDAYRAGKITKEERDAALRALKAEHPKGGKKKGKDGNYYSGISYVPRNMKGVTLHKGERVVPAHENRPGQASSGGPTSPSSNYSNSSRMGTVIVQSVVDGSVIDSAVVGANADGRATGVSRMVRKTAGKRAGIRAPGNNPWGRS